MSQYRNVLVAIDLSEDSTPVVQRGRAIAEGSAAELHLIHVIEPLSFAYGGDIPMDFSGIQEEIHQQATQQLHRFAETNSIDAQHQHILLGKPEVEIHAKAEELVRRMGIDPDQKWAANYQILPGKEKVVNELVKLAANADAIYLATDLDREGEAIAWHLKEAIGGDESRYQRVVFNEITKKAVSEAFERPATLDMDRVNAQQARRFLDRVVGFMVSLLPWVPFYAYERPERPVLWGQLYS